METTTVTQRFAISKEMKQIEDKRQILLKDLVTTCEVLLRFDAHQTAFTVDKTYLLSQLNNQQWLKEENIIFYPETKLRTTSIKPLEFEVDADSSVLQREYPNVDISQLGCIAVLMMEYIYGQIDVGIPKCLENVGIEVDHIKSKAFPVPNLSNLLLKPGYASKRTCTDRNYETTGPSVFENVGVSGAPMVASNSGVKNLVSIEHLSDFIDQLHKEIINPPYIPQQELDDLCKVCDNLENLLNGTWKIGDKIFRTDDRNKGKSNINSDQQWDSPVFPLEPHT